MDCLLRQQMVSPVTCKSDPLRVHARLFMFAIMVTGCSSTLTHATTIAQGEWESTTWFFSPMTGKRVYHENFCAKTADVVAVVKIPRHEKQCDPWKVVRSDAANGLYVLETVCKPPGDPVIYVSAQAIVSSDGRSAHGVFHAVIDGVPFVPPPSWFVTRLVGGCTG